MLSLLRKHFLELHWEKSAIFVHKKSMSQVLDVFKYVKYDKLREIVSTRKRREIQQFSP